MEKKLKEGDTWQQEMKNKVETVEKGGREKEGQWKHKCEKVWKI